MNQYEEQLVPHLKGYPSDSSLIGKLNALDQLIPHTPVNGLQRFFGRSVGARDPRHPQHATWIGVQAAHARSVETFRQHLILRRKAALRDEEAARQGHAFWRTLSGTEFEHNLAKLMVSAGFSVKHVGGRGDEGADLMASLRGVSAVVQCKAYAKQVGPGPVRDLLGALLHHRAKEAWLVSLVGFSDAAIRFAAGKPIRLLPIEALLGTVGAERLKQLGRKL